MRYVGVDLHKQSISLCVVELADRQLNVIERKRFRSDQELEMADYFAQLGSSNSLSKPRPVTNGSLGWSSRWLIVWC